MCSRRVEVRRIATTQPYTFLDVVVSYDDAKNDFMGYGSRVRGYYLIVSVIEDKQDGFIKFRCGLGGKGLLESAARFNARRMSQLAEAAGFPGNEAFERIVQNVATRNSLTLAEAPEEAESLVTCGPVS